MILLFSGIFFPARAQFFVDGESPASIRWMQIKTPQFNVVFPRGLERDAERLITDLKKTATLTEIPYHRPVRRIPVLLNSSSIRSNGFVTWTPKRMELILTPPQDSYAQDWTGQLALHEYRHVVQISQLNQGFTSVLSWFTGEIAMGLSTAIMPTWFYEGDAVLNETQNSAAGRGRLPSFEMPVKALLMGDRRIYDYNKVWLGSYRDYVPNHYQYGYQIVSYANSHYGKEFWPEAIDYSARHLYLFSPLAVYFLFHHHTGKGRIYLAAMDSLKYQYQNEKDYTTYTNYSPIDTRNSGTYTHYKFPHLLPDGRYFALKSGIDQLDEFILLGRDGKESKLLITGTLSGNKVDVQGYSVVWDEIVSDPRWQLRSYSEIRKMDLISGKVTRLTRRSRYFSPVFSPDGKQIAVSETDPANRHFLTLLDAEKGSVILRIPAPDNREITFPAWKNAGTVIAVTISQDGKQLEEADIRSGSWQVLMPFTRYNISEPVVAGKYIVFRSSYGGTENLFAFNPASHRLYRVTNARFGAFHPAISPDSLTLLFNVYSENGFDMTSLPLHPADWKPVQGLSGPEGRWANAGQASPYSKTWADTAGAESYRAVPYSKLAHLWHVHSWLPFYVPIDEVMDNLTYFPIQPGVMIFSQNLLSTFISSIGYRYSNGYNYINPKITWKGWYPVIDFSAEIGGPARTFAYPEGIEPSGINSPYYDYHIKSYLPLSFDRGKYIAYVQPQIEYEHNSTRYFSEGYEYTGLDYLHYSLYASQYLRMSLRDLYPRLGAYILGWFTTTPGDNHQLGSMFSVQAGLYLPGLLRHHHLLLRGGWQEQQPGLYYMSINRLLFPRGYSEVPSAGIRTFSADYAFPVAYPDFSAGPVIYLKRIRMDLFYDRSYGHNIFEKDRSPYTGAYTSTGGELYADFHAGRIIFPVSAGVRVAYLFNSDRVYSEFLFRFRVQ